MALVAVPSAPCGLVHQARAPHQPISAVDRCAPVIFCAAVSLFDPPAVPERIPLVLSAIVSPWRRLIEGLVAFNSPGQLAAGFALGMIIGMMPKGNLIALSLCVLLFSLRCNKGLAVLSAAIFTCTATWTDPFAHKLGLATLSIEPMQATYASMFTLPLGPWLGFDNTVVTGSLLLGLYVAYPVYWMVRLACSTVMKLSATRPAWDGAAPQLEGAP
jgi:uncharacterized protein (TIGR03546 family)